MDIKIGDIIFTQNNKIGFKILGNGASYGYDLIDLRNNTVYYDVLVGKSESRNNLYTVNISKIDCRYRVGDYKKFNNGESGILVKKNKTGDISIQFDNGSILKFRTVFAFANGYATSDRDTNKEYEINVGDIVTFNKFITGTVIEADLGSKTATINIGGKLVNVDCRKCSIPTSLHIESVRHVLTGKTMTYDNGLIGEIKDVKNLTHIIVKFSDGTEREMKYERFINPRPLRRRKTCLNDKVYQKNIKMYALLKERLGGSMVRVELEDGTNITVSGSSYREGRITYIESKSKSVADMKIVQNDGRIAEVVEVKGRDNVDVKIEGKLYKDVSKRLLRKGLLTKSYFGTKDCLGIKDTFTTVTVCNLFYSIESTDGDNSVLIWNNVYREVVKSRNLFAKLTPSCMTYSCKKNKLIYKNIEITRYKLFERDIEIEGVCLVCGKPVKTCISKIEYGHNCLDGKTTDSIGCKIDIRHVNVNRYEITYEDNCKILLTYTSQTKNKWILHSGLERTGFGYARLINTKFKVITMYYDSVAKKYRLLLEYKKKRIMGVL